MVKSFFSEVSRRFNDPFINRLRTPFFGTLILGIILYNWELVFTLFNFDRFTVRASRIQIIEEYLKKEGLFFRLIKSSLWALVSLFTYYVFSTLATAVVILAKWAKAAITQLTDRGQTVIRAEHESLKHEWAEASNKISELRNELMHRNRELRESEEEVKKLMINDAELRGGISELTNENTTLKANLTLLGVEPGGVNILSAVYGTVDKNIDVTQLVRQLQDKKSFIVSNETLGGDPAYRQIKDLLITFSYGGEIKRLKAIEGSKINFEGDKLEVSETEVSKLKQLQRENEKEIAQLFAGNRVLEFTKAETRRQERVLITADGQYYRNGQRAFRLTAIDIDPKTGNISFDKIKPDGTIHTKEQLKKTKNGEFVGRDNKGFNLRYFVEKLQIDENTKSQV